MSLLFSRRGSSALARLAAGRSLLVFDLDGTLAPLVARPDDARVPALTASRLRALVRLWPVAIITGRALEDARGRLGFEPHYLYGNHGAERSGDAASTGLAARLDPLRRLLRERSDDLTACEIEVEDKGLSLALHYRRAIHPAAARQWLENFASMLPAGVVAGPGHCVMNLTLAQAANKGDALLQVLRDADAASALVVGDDANDEPAFANAPQGSVSVRIGAQHTPTVAAFRLAAQSQVNVLLSMLLALRG